MLRGRHLALFVLIGVFTSVAWPAGLQQPDYPGARVIHSIEKQDAWYLLALGSITRSKGEWQPAATERLRGSLHRQSYELPYGHTSEEAHEAYLKTLAPKTRRVLFNCSGRGCGASNFWANRIFEVKELYGPEEHQRYTAVEIEDEGKLAVVAIYSIERANRRAYLHIDWLDKAQNGPEQSISAADIIKSGQSVSLAFHSEGWDVAMLDSIAALMKSDKDLQLYIVGHAYEGAELSGMRQKATVYAREVADRLQERGVAAERLSVFGLGPLAPGNKPVDRVELIRR